MKKSLTIALLVATLSLGVTSTITTLKACSIETENAFVTLDVRESYLKTVIVEKFTGDNGNRYAEVLHMEDFITVKLTEQQFEQLESGDVVAYSIRYGFLNEIGVEKVEVIRKGECTTAFTLYQGE